jgi:hypothetical protein
LRLAAMTDRQHLASRHVPREVRPLRRCLTVINHVPWHENGPFDERSRRSARLVERSSAE